MHAGTSTCRASSDRRVSCHRCTLWDSAVCWVWLVLLATSCSCIRTHANTLKSSALSSDQIQGSCSESATHHSLLNQLFVSQFTSFCQNKTTIIIFVIIITFTTINIITPYTGTFSMIICKFINFLTFTTTFIIVRTTFIFIVIFIIITINQ